MHYGMKHHLVRPGPTRKRAPNSNRRRVTPAHHHVYEMLADPTGIIFSLSRFLASQSRTHKVPRREVKAQLQKRSLYIDIIYYQLVYNCSVV